MIENALTLRKVNVKTKITVKTIVAVSLVILAIAFPQLIHLVAGASGGMNFFLCICLLCLQVHFSALGGGLALASLHQFLVILSHRHSEAQCQCFQDFHLWLLNSLYLPSSQAYFLIKLQKINGLQFRQSCLLKLVEDWHFLPWLVFLKAFQVFHLTWF